MTLWLPSERVHQTRSELEQTGQGCKLLGLRAPAAAPPSHLMSSRAVGLNPTCLVCKHVLVVCVLVISHSKQPLPRSGRSESSSNADVWDDGRPVNTNKHDLNKQSDSPPK